MDISNKYCFYVGTAGGALKHTYCKYDEKDEDLIGEMSEITALEWGRTEDEIAVGYKSGLVSLYSPIENKFIKTMERLEGDGAVTGIGAAGRSIFVAKQGGVITLWTGRKSDYFSVNLEEKATLNAMVLSKNGKVIATGGEGCNLRLWDARTYQCTFMALPMNNDKLNTPIPTSIRALTFLSNNVVTVCVTRDGHVLLYDPRTQRKPVINFYEKDANYTCIAETFRESQCFTGTTNGCIQMLDLKAPKKLLRTMTGFTGGVTSIVCDPTESVVATTSLDNYLRVHNYETQDLLHEAYLEENLTKVLMKPVGREQQTVDTDDTEEDLDDAEFEELYGDIVLENNLSKRKRKAVAIGKRKFKKAKSV